MQVKFFAAEWAHLTIFHISDEMIDALSENRSCRGFCEKAVTRFGEGLCDTLQIWNDISPSDKVSLNGKRYWRFH